MEVLNSIDFLMFAEATVVSSALQLKLTEKIKKMSQIQVY